MTNARQLVESKARYVASLPPSASVLDAARLMNERQIGSVLIIDNGRLLGIFTERDVLQRIVAEQRDPAHTMLENVMTSAVACASSSTKLDELRKVMRNHRIRHIPVVEDNVVLGMVSLGDLNRAERDVQIETIQYLERYVSVF